MVLRNASLLWGLFFLRLGLSLFLILWAIDKIVAPEATVDMYLQRYSIGTTASVVSIVGAFELVLGLLMFLGMYKTITYGLGLLLQITSVIFSFSALLFPFGEDHIYISVFPIFFSFLSLFLLRELDTKLTFSKKKSIFS